MFDAIKAFVEGLAGQDEPARFADNDYRVAAAALLIHATVIDGNTSEAERRRLLELLKKRFDLNDARAEQLVEQATSAEHEAIDLYQFTQLLNRALDQDGRSRMIEMMWEITLTDGNVTEFEDNLIWRVADLLNVPSTERIALRQRVATRGSSGA